MDTSSMKSISIPVSSCYPSFIMIPHYKHYLRTLFDGSFPIFVAVTISNAVVAFIHAFVDSINHHNDTTLIIALNFLYSLIFGYILGVYIMLNQAKWVSVKNYVNYMHNVAIENASFAWFATISLIILKRVYNGKSYSFGYAIAAWLFTVLIVLLIIYFTNYFRHIYRGDNIDDKITSNLIEFDSGSFSLSIAFGLTIIIAASIVSNESTNYLSGIDDISSSNDDGRNDYMTIPYVAYAIFITILIISYEYYRIQYENYLLNDDNNISNDASDSKDDHQPSSASYGCVGTCMSGCYSRYKDIITRLDVLLFSWDQKNLTKTTITELFSAIRADLVACAWYTWSILAFQNYFSFTVGSLVGLLIYSVAVTYIVLWLISRYTIYPNDDDTKLSSDDISPDISSSSSYNIAQRSESDASSIHHLSRDSMSSSQRLTNVSLKSIQDEMKVVVRSDLLLMSGKLIVGWAWQQFISSCVSMIFDRDIEGRLWYTAIIKCCIALFVTIFGAYLYYAWEKKLLLKLAALARKSTSIDAEDSSSSSNHIRLDVKQSIQTQQEGLRVPLLG